MKSESTDPSSSSTTTLCLTSDRPIYWPGRLPRLGGKTTTIARYMEATLTGLGMVALFPLGYENEDNGLAQSQAHCVNHCVHCAQAQTQARSHTGTRTTTHNQCIVQWSRIRRYRHEALFSNLSAVSSPTARVALRLLGHARWAGTLGATMGRVKK